MMQAFEVENQWLPGYNLPPVGIKAMITPRDPTWEANEAFESHVGEVVEIVAHIVDEDGDSIAIYSIGDTYHGLIADWFGEVPAAPVKKKIRTIEIEGVAYDLDKVLDVIKGLEVE